MKGLKVPENPSPPLTRIGLIETPNDAEWVGIIRGLLLEACFGYWWDKNSGDWEDAKQTACSIASSFMTVEFCQEVARCIRTSPEVQGEIKNYFNEITNIINPATKVKKIDYGCSADSVYGGVSRVVDFLNNKAVDTFEKIEVLTNVAELLTEWLDNFSSITAVNSVIGDLLAWLQDTALEQYEAQYTLELRDEYICDLFCMWLASDCEGVSPLELAQYFAERLANDVPFTDLQSLISYVLTGDWDSSQWVDAVNVVMIGVMTVADAIPFLNIRSLAEFDTQYAVGYKFEPSGAWSELCSECPPEPIEWCHAWLGGYGIDEYLTNADGGIYSVADDWYSGTKDGSGALVELSFDALGEDIELTVNTSYNTTRSSAYDGIRIYNDDVLVTFDQVIVNGVQSKITTVSISGAGVVRLRMIAGGNNATDASYVRCTKIVVSGESVSNPFVLDNCG